MTLTSNDFARAAAALGCDVAAIRAVDAVESAGAGFDAQNRVKILFEPGQFRKLTGGKYNTSHPDLSHPYDPRDPSYRRDQHDVFGEAAALDYDAAVQATSWGRYQILGSNWRAAGCASLREFERAMRSSESRHLDSFVAFVRANPAMHKALQQRQWLTFALAYNGPRQGEKDNGPRMAKGYHVRIAMEFEKCKGHV